MTNVLMPDSAPMALKLNTRKPQRITITVSWSLYQSLLDTSDEQGRSLSNIAAYWLERMAEESLARGH
jgi:hypothetical protein